MVTARGRSALMVATALLLGFAAPSHAASSADGAAAPATRPVKHVHRLAHRHYARAKWTHVRKEEDADNASANDTRSKDARTKDERNTDPGAPSAAIPPSVANANAQWPAAASPAANAPPVAAATAPTGPANTPSNAAAPPDQLSDADRAKLEQAPATPAVAMASAEARPAGAAQAAANDNDHSVWDETSLIGKIFIGFGALLTLASAARMFMA